MKRTSIYTLALINALLFTASAHAVLGELIACIPASLGVYGTYKTLMDKPSLFNRHFAQACIGFDRAMDSDFFRMKYNNSLSWSTVLQSGLVNSSYHFKPHERIAIAGSIGAIAVGAMLISGGSLKSLHDTYKVWSTEGAEREQHTQKRKNALIATGIGCASMVVGWGCMLTLADYVDSYNQSKRW